MIVHSLKDSFNQNIFRKIAGIFAYPALRAFKIHFDPRKYNGASLLGLRGIVVKSHGGADIKAFSHAIEMAYLEVKNAVPQRISERVELIFADRKTA